MLMRKPSVRLRMISACSLKSASVQLELILKFRIIVDRRIFSLRIAYLRPTQLRGPALNGMNP